MATRRAGARTVQSAQAVAQDAARAGSTRKATSGARSVLWLDSPQEHDYPAAASYLSLLAGPKKTRALVTALRDGPVAHYKAKDILRASGLPLLPPDNVHVAKDLAEIRAGNPLSPCLMIRGNARKWHQALIADGYHRVCASCYVDENTDIPVKIVTL